MDAIGSSHFFSSLPNFSSISKSLPRPLSFDFFSFLSFRKVENEQRLKSDKMEDLVSITVDIAQKAPRGAQSKQLEQRLNTLEPGKMHEYLTLLTKTNLLDKALTYIKIESLDAVLKLKHGFNSCQEFVQKKQTTSDIKTQIPQENLFVAKARLLYKAIFYVVDTFIRAFRMTTHTLWDKQAVIDMICKLLIVPSAIFHMLGLLSFTTMSQLVLTAGFVLGAFYAVDAYVKYGPAPTHIPDAENLSLRTNLKDYVIHEKALDNAINALESGKSILFVGPVGAGKTTLLKQLAQRLKGREKALHLMNAALFGTGGYQTPLDRLKNIRTYIEGHEKAVILGIDECQKALSNQQFVDALLQHVQPGEERSLHFAGAMTQEDYDKLELSNAFTDRFEVITLKPATEEQKEKILRQEIENKFWKEGIPFENSEKKIKELLEKPLRAAVQELASLQAKKKYPVWQHTSDLEGAALKARLARYEGRPENLEEVDQEKKKAESDALKNREFKGMHEKMMCETKAFVAKDEELEKIFRKGELSKKAIVEYFYRSSLPMPG